MSKISLRRDRLKLISIALKNKVWFHLPELDRLTLIFSTKFYKCIKFRAWVELIEQIKTKILNLISIMQSKWLSKTYLEGMKKALQLSEVFNCVKNWMYEPTYLIYLGGIWI